MICPRKSSTKKGHQFNCDYHIGVNKLSYCKLRDEFLCVERIECGMPRLSYSSVSDWIVCKRLYFLKHVKGIRRLDAMGSKPLKMGSLWDTCLQVLTKDAPSSEIGKCITRNEIQPREVAKVKAVYRAWKDLEINIDMMCKSQARFELPLVYQIGKINADFVVTGVFDRLYEDWFAEAKFSGKPDWYHSLFNIIPQVGTYFLSNLDLKYVNMEVTRVPDLKSTGKFKEEGDKDYEERCYQDIISRPTFYFPGLDRDTHTFGKRFYRTEFPLAEIKRRYSAIYFEMTEAANRSTIDDVFWKNWNSCLNHFGQCDMIDVCQYNNISEELYTIKPKPKKVVEVPWVAPVIESTNTPAPWDVERKQLVNDAKPFEYDSVTLADDDIPF